MASMTELHRKGFEERLARINSGGPNCIGELHVGPRQEVRARDAQKAIKRQVRAAQRRGSPMVSLLLLPVAVAIGALSMFTGRVTSYQFFTGDDAIAFALMGVPVEMFADVAIAGVLALALAWAFHLTWGLRRIGVLAGVVMMMTAEIQLMEQFPDIFATFFSDTYVASALSDGPTRL